MYPLDRNIILANCSSWRSTPTAQARAILAAIDPLIEIARTNGWVKDPEIHAAVGDLVDFGPATKTEYTTFNQRRACWGNHEQVIAEYKRVKQEKVAKQAEEQRRKAEKQANKVQKQQAAEAALKRKLDVQQGNEAEPRAKKVKESYCSNQACMLPWSSVGEGDEAWIYCEHKGCQLCFCAQNKCKKSLAAHQAVCPKKKSLPTRKSWLLGAAMY